MADTSKREELIEALAAGVHEGDGWMSDAQNARLEWDGPNRVIHFCGQGSIDVGHLAAIAEAVFEQARIPADDELVTEVYLDGKWQPATDLKPGVEYVLRTRRTVQGEPSGITARTPGEREAFDDELATGLNSVRDRDLTEIEARAVTTAAALAQATGMTVSEVIATINQIGGEPTDAAVTEAVHAIGLRGFHVTASAMRAALRAAYETKGEGR